MVTKKKQTPNSKLLDMSPSPVNNNLDKKKVTIKTNSLFNPFPFFDSIPTFGVIMNSDKLYKGLQSYWLAEDGSSVRILERSARKSNQHMRFIVSKADRKAILSFSFLYLPLSKTHESGILGLARNTFTTFYFLLFTFYFFSFYFLPFNFLVFTLHEPLGVIDSIHGHSTRYITT